jgi:hypothetical protein
MQLKFELLPGVLRAEIRGRETAQETRESAEAIFAERAKHGVLAVLLVVKESRPIFKVEEYGLSGLFDRVVAIPGMRIASVGDSAELRSAHEYIELLAKQRGVALRAFASEREALAWLRG